MGKNKLLVICGPTAMGKTALAIKLAKSALGGKGELISADSRQVYKGMDVGTGKDHPPETKIHLIDVVFPDQEFSVSHYYRLAWLAIKKIWKKGKLPILIGGTGFYIKAVVEGVETLGVKPDWGLRERLSNYGVAELQRVLEETCPKRLGGMNESDRNNPRRLIRAIELSVSSKQLTVNSKRILFDALLMIGLKAPYKILYGRIDQRVEERVKKGVEREIKNLLKRGYNFDDSVLGTTIGYKEWKEKMPNEEIVKRWKFAEHGYARRQMTWFKKSKKIHWFDITKPGYQLKVVRLVKQWYYEN